MDDPVGHAAGRPVFGALPPAGVASDWLLAWLVLGVSAGAVAGVVVASKGRTSVVGVLGSAVLAGLLAALGYLAWAAAGRGDLGILRLVDLGPRLTESAVIGAPLLVLSAAVGGLVAWFVRRKALSGLSRPGFDRLDRMPKRLVVLVSGSGTLPGHSWTRPPPAS